MNKKFRMEFAQRLKQERISKKITQQVVADSLHINRSTYAYYEKGKTLPSLEILANISWFFHVSTDYLLGLCNTPET